MRLELMLRNLGGRLLRAVPCLARMPSTHLMVLGGGQGRALLGSESLLPTPAPWREDCTKPPRAHRP